MIYKCFKIQIKYQKIRNYILCEDGEGYFMIFIYLFICIVFMTVKHFAP